MRKNIRISAVISAYNEEKKIARCLDSLSWTDEIIFVDNSSTDSTVKIAQKYTDKIYSQKNDPANIDLQKNTAIDKATGDWVLLIDADEVVSAELADEIKKIDFGNMADSINSFFIPRKNIIFGKWIEYTGWYPDRQIRLFKKGYGRYDKKHYHEMITVNGTTGFLSEHIIHYNYETIGQFLYKHLFLYAPNEAEEMIRRGFEFDWKGVIRMPMSEFLSRYFAREGYRDGFHGLVLSVLMAFYHAVIFLHIWEKEKFDEQKGQNVLEGFEEEMKKSGKEIKYWLNAGRVNSEKSFFRKYARKIRNKISI